MKKNLLAAVSSAALLFATGAWADGGPVPEETPPPPPPVYDEPAPVHEPAPAPEYNWYTTIFAGAAFGNDLDLAVANGEEAFSVEAPLETGYLLGWTLGYDNLFGGDMISFRPEVELSFRQQDIDLDEAFGGELSDLENVSIPTDLLTLMANLWVDFEFNGVTPYLGGGVGIGWADLPFVFAPFHIESTDFVWQFGGGLNFDVNERVFVGVGYRYLGADFEEGDIFGPGGTIEYEYRTHEVLGNLGVRF